MFPRCLVVDKRSAKFSDSDLRSRMLRQIRKRRETRAATLTRRCQTCGFLCLDNLPCIRCCKYTRLLIYPNLDTGARDSGGNFSKQAARNLKPTTSSVERGFLVAKAFEMMFWGMPPE